jgi:hypothetical protein
VVNSAEWKDCADLLWILTKMETDGVQFDISDVQDLFKEVGEVVDDEDLLDGNDRGELKGLLDKFTSES